MSQDELAPDGNGVEAALAALVPRPLQISREDLIYTAGIRAAQRRYRRLLPVWLGSVAVLLAVVSTLVGAIVANTGAGAQQQSVVDATGAATEPQSTPDGPQPTPATPNALPEPAVATQWNHAFSRIWNVNHWDLEQLQTHGISIEPCSEWCDAYDPPFEWVTIRFDCSSLTDGHEVFMAAQFIRAERDAASNSYKTDLATRSVRGVPDKNGVSLDLAISNNNYYEQSYITIMIWPSATEKVREAHGYTLHLKRIVELARLHAKEPPGR